MPISRTFGAVTVTALQDAEGPFFESRKTAFPAATGHHWTTADALDPGAVRDGRWWLRFRSYALRLDDGRLILVDTGIGPADAPAKVWAPVPGRLPAELAVAGIDRDEVDLVVLTHLHSDHVGWAVDGAAAEPFFPNAGYLLQNTEIAAVAGSELDTWLVRPLRSSGRLTPLDGEASLGAGVRVVPTPGHTPGHQSVLLATGPENLLLTGDLLVHAIQLVDPELAYAYESDPETARLSRTSLLRELAATGETVLATPHLTEPFLPLGPHA